METSLNFQKNGQTYQTRFTSSGGGCIVQLERDENSQVVVYANLPGMEPTLISIVKNQYDTGIMFRLDVPSGIEVTIESVTEVKSAKMFTE